MRRKVKSIVSVNDFPKLLDLGTNLATLVYLNSRSLLFSNVLQR